VAFTQRFFLPLFLVVTLAAALAGCAPSSPEAEIAKIRSEYKGRNQRPTVW